MSNLLKYTQYKTVLSSNILIFAEGKVLLMKRAKNKIVDPGRFSGIGGKVEPGESYLQTAIRELEEETGIKLKNLKPYGITQTIDPPTGAEWVSVNFIGKIPKIVNIPPSEDGEFYWVKPVEAEKLDIVNDLKKYIKILAKNDSIFLLSQYIFDKQGKLISEDVKIFSKTSNSTSG